MLLAILIEARSGWDRKPCNALRSSTAVLLAHQLHRRWHRPALESMCLPIDAAFREQQSETARSQEAHLLFEQQPRLGST